MKTSIEPKHITEWDYNGWKDVSNKLYQEQPAPQSDWNVTLITKINYISALIHESTFRGGANIVTINPRLEGLIASNPYYNNNILGGRYKVILDSSIDENEIHIKHEEKHSKIKDGFIMIASKTGEVGEDGFENVSLKLHEVEKDKELVEEYISKTMGIIKVENYGE